MEGKMDTMGGAFRKLKRQVADATKNAESLQLLATIQTAANEAAKLIPAKAADLPAADRAKFEADYQAGMKKLIDGFGKLEVALKADKNDEAAKLVGEIGALQKAGHKEFKRPDEK
jgi:soluble cytochrome b562